MVRVRGIVNNTTACHVTSSLVLLCHCLSPIRETLLLSRTLTARGSSRVHRELSRFLREYCLCEKQEWIGEQEQQEEFRQHKPMMLSTNLYEALLSETGIQAEDVGDAVTTLAKMLDHLRRCGDTLPVSQVLRESLDGRCHRIIRDGRRRKILPPRSLPCPYPVRVAAVDDVSTTTTLLEALRESLRPQELQGYQWTGDFEEVVPVEPSAVTLDNNNLPSVATTRTLVIDQAPPIWLIQLEWYRVGDRPVEDSSQNISRMDIPIVLDASSLRVNAEYRLVGGIVRVSYGSEVGDGSDAGHTVSVLRLDDDASDDDVDSNLNWYVVDDNTVRRVSTETSQKMLGGCQMERGTARGVLAVYQQVGWEWQSLVSDVMAAEETLDSITEQSTSTSVDWTKPLLLVERRVRVKWAKGKWYEGRVSCYDPQTGKYTIAYDDGDVRSYKLEKKVVEWLE